MGFYISMDGGHLAVNGLTERAAQAAHFAQCDSWAALCVPLLPPGLPIQASAVLCRSTDVV